MNIHELSTLALRYGVISVLIGGCPSDDAPPANSDGESTTAGESSNSATPSSTSEASEGASQGSEDSSSSGGDNPGEPAGPAVIATQLLSEDATVSYLVVADAVEGELSIDDGIEIAGRALVAGPGDGHVYVGSNLEGTITRYDLRDGALATGESVSFMAEGVTGIGEYASQFYFLSPSRAYYFDGGGARAIAWNPELMTIEDTLDLPDATVPDTVLTFTSITVLEAAGKLHLPLGWRSTDNLTIIPRAGIVIIDPDAGMLTTAIDERCGYVRDAVLADDGRIYVATEAYGAAVYRVAPSRAPAPCLLRFDPEVGAFDPEFHVELASLVGDGAIVGSMIDATDGTALVRVFDESMFEITDETHPRALASAPAWQWWSLALGDAPVATAATWPASSGSMLRIELGDRTFVPEFSGDRSSTSLREIVSGTESELVATIPGMVFSAADL